MGFFDGLTNGIFKRDKNGNMVFFPWGVLGRGRILPDEITESKVRGFVRRYYQVTLPMIIGVGVVVGWAWSFLLVPIFGAWFYFGTKSLISGCPYSEGKLTLKESYVNSATRHNKFTLWILFICSLLFVAGAIWLAISTNSPSEMLEGWFSVIFFGACSAAIGYMLKVKHT